MSGRVERVEVVEHGGVTYLRWTCETCGHDNERSLYYLPWYCSKCGAHDRGVEMDAETVHERRRSA